MRPLLAIAFNTYREVVRQRLFALILAITTVLLVLLAIIPYFVLAEETAMFKDLAIRSVALAMAFLVALTASSAVAEEMESRTAMAVLAKPVTRTQFLVGKYLGILLALLLATAIMGALLFLTTYFRVYHDATPTEQHYAFSFARGEPARQFQALMWHQATSVLPGAVTVFYQAAVLAAVAVVLSSRFSRVLAVIVTFGLFMVGNLVDFITAAVAHSPAPTRHAADWLVAVLPPLAAFDVTRKISHAVLVPGQSDFAAAWSYTAWAGLAALAYAVFILLLGSALFRRREIR